MVPFDENRPKLVTVGVIFREHGRLSDLIRFIISPGQDILSVFVGLLVVFGPDAAQRKKNRQKLVEKF